MFYIGVVLLVFGVMRLIAAIIGTVRLDRQLAGATEFTYFLRAREIEAARSHNAFGFIWSFIALTVGVILVTA